VNVELYKQIFISIEMANNNVEMLDVMDDDDVTFGLSLYGATIGSVQDPAQSEHVNKMADGGGVQDTALFWLNGVATNVLVIIGLIANCFTLSVLCRRLMTSSTNSYLSALAVWDSVVLVCTALLIGLPAITITYRQQVRQSLQYLCN